MLLHLLIEVVMLNISIVAPNKLVHSLTLPNHDIKPLTRTELVVLLLESMHISNGTMRFPSTLELHHHKVDQETLKFLYEGILCLKFFVLLLRSRNTIYKIQKNLLGINWRYLLKSLRWSRSCWGSRKPIIFGSRMVCRSA